MLIITLWWEKYGAKIFLTGFVLTVAWLLRQTQGGAIAEFYYLITRPFQGESEQVIIDQLSNAQILELKQRLTEKERQNQELKKLLGYWKQQKQPAMVAPIIGRSADEWWQQATIGLGSKDGIEKDFVVTGVGGLVGRIINITPHTSRVLLISDPSSRVGAMISRTRHLGFIQGKDSQLVTMQFFEKVPDVKPGDVVVTSSVSSLFPSGIPIGTVKTMEVTKGPAPQAIIEITAPLNYIEWVVIHPFENQHN